MVGQPGSSEPRRLAGTRELNSQAQEPWNLYLRGEILSGTGAVEVKQATIRVSLDKP